MNSLKTSQLVSDPKFKARQSDFKASSFNHGVFDFPLCSGKESDFNALFLKENYWLHIMNKTKLMYFFIPNLSPLNGPGFVVTALSSIFYFIFYTLYVLTSDCLSRFK